MAKMRGAVVIDTERCKGCNLCVVACPTQTLALSKTAVNHRGYAFSEDVNAESLDVLLVLRYVPMGASLSIVYVNRNTIFTLIWFNFMRL